MRNILAPIRRNHIIAELPQCFTKGAALYSRSSFRPQVVGMFQAQWTGTMGFKVSKIIVAGDLCGEELLDQSVCRDTIDKNYKVTIGVDLEGFEVPAAVGHSWPEVLQMHRASTYYHGAQPIIIFDLSDMGSLGHTRQSLVDALKENNPSNIILKKDLSSPAKYSFIKRDTLKVTKEMEAEYCTVSSLTDENVREFFFLVAELTFKGSVMAELERSSTLGIGDAKWIHSAE